MDPLLNARPVWMDPTAEIHALDGESILVKQESGDKSAKLRVNLADPNGPDAGKCKVAVWNTWTEDFKWGSSGTASGRTGVWEQYLSPEAIKLIGKNPKDQQYGKLLLVIPPAET